MSDEQTAVFTVGHSTRSLDDLTALLEEFGVDLLCDIRSIPRSRHVPHFNADALETGLPERGLGYVVLPELGGRRSTTKDSPNTGWRNAGFRGYADHMQTATFREGIERLLDLARQHTPAVMCAEAVPWRCHRSLVGDALLVRGLRVVDILDRGQAREHTLTSFASVDGLEIVYPE